MRASEIASEELVLFLLPLGTPPVIIGTDEVSPSSSSSDAQPAVGGKQKQKNVSWFFQAFMYFIHNHATPDPVLRASIVISMFRMQFMKHFVHLVLMDIMLPLTSFIQMHQRVIVSPFLLLSYIDLQSAGSLIHLLALQRFSVYPI